MPHLISIEGEGGLKTQREGDSAKEGLLRPYKKGYDSPKPVLLPPEIDDAQLNCLLDKLFYEKGHDFRGYKKSSLKRRISRRMRLNDISHYEEYLRLLDSSPAEHQRLFNDLVIRVTCFFRDTHPFYILRDRIIPDIISKKETDKEIRIWCPGCATGEEPYSIGMLLLEVLKTEIGRYNIKIFGTDISEDAVEKARLGIYSPFDFEGMRKEYRNAYFIPLGDKFRIKFSVRGLMRYGMHNLVNHPPISRLDLIFCRNVLIYFEKTLQEKVFRDFYYALKPKGYLVLGKSEVIINEFRDAFIEIDRKARIYQRL